MVIRDINNCQLYFSKNTPDIYMKCFVNSAFFRINPASRSFRLFGERRVIVLGMEWSRWCADWPILWLWRNAARDLVVLHLTAVTHYHGACLRRKMLNFLISPLFFFFFPFIALRLRCRWKVLSTSQTRMECLSGQVQKMCLFTLLPLCDICSVEAV